LKFIEVIED